MKKTLLLLSVFALIALTTGCDSQDVPPGYKGFMFDRTGALAAYSGGSGLQTGTVINSGTHYTGMYDTIVGVNCQTDANKESIQVLTKSDMKVTVDLRITYASDCTTKESLASIVQKVPRAPQSSYVQPDQVFQAFVMPSIRESLRNNLAEVTIEDVKTVRSKLSTSIRKDVEKSIAAKNFPVRIDLLTVSDITLPEAITNKIKDIEVARMEANKETEKQRAAKVRLERELFEAQEDRKVQREKAEKAKEVAQVNATADLEVKKLAAQADFEARKLEAQGMSEIRKQLTREYIEYLRLQKDAEVRSEMAKAMGKGTVYYLDGTKFAVPPGTNTGISVSSP